jgi:hypothetical protein
MPSPLVPAPGNRMVFASIRSPAPLTNMFPKLFNLRVLCAITLFSLSERLSAS